MYVYFIVDSNWFILCPVALEPTLKVASEPLKANQVGLSRVSLHFRAKALRQTMSLSDLTFIVPLLITLLDPAFPDGFVFIAASDALQEQTH